MVKKCLMQVIAGLVALFKWALSMFASNSAEGEVKEEVAERPAPAREPVFDVGSEDWMKQRCGMILKHAWESAKDKFAPVEKETEDLKLHLKWAAHPDSTILSIESFTYNVARFSAEIEHRRWERKSCQPDKSAHSHVNHEDIDIWSTIGAVKDTYEWEDCTKCHDSGRLECPECHGVKEWECPVCHGNATWPCPNCHGVKGLKRNCSVCYGKGRVDCPECKGTGKSKCQKCGGKGKIRCPDCNNVKTHQELRYNCYNCHGTGRGDGFGGECGICGGSGLESRAKTFECRHYNGKVEKRRLVKCRSCHGTGRGNGFGGGCGICGGTGQDVEVYTEPCETCKGTTYIQCNECGGDDKCHACSGLGSRECKECKGKGKVDCIICGGTGIEKCKKCGGKGRIRCYVCDDDGRIVCPDCKGAGGFAHVWTVERDIESIRVIKAWSAEIPKTILPCDQFPSADTVLGAATVYRKESRADGWDAAMLAGADQDVRPKLEELFNEATGSRPLDGMMRANRQSVEMEEISSIVRVAVKAPAATSTGDTCCNGLTYICWINLATFELLDISVDGRGPTGAIRKLLESAAKATGRQRAAYYAISAMMGNAAGMSGYGKCLAEGDGVEKSPYEASFWNQIAFRLGFKGASADPRFQWSKLDGRHWKWIEEAYPKLLVWRNLDIGKIVKKLMSDPSSIEWYGEIGILDRIPDDDRVKLAVKYTEHAPRILEKKVDCANSGISPWGILRIVENGWLSDYTNGTIYAYDWARFKAGDWADLLKLDPRYAVKCKYRDIDWSGLSLEQWIVMLKSGPIGMADMFAQWESIPSDEWPGLVKANPALWGNRLKYDRSCQEFNDVCAKYLESRNVAGIVHGSQAVLKSIDLDAVGHFAANGHAVAMLIVGDSLLAGHIADKSDPEAVKAVEWYRKAADTNLPEAQFMVGWCLQHGLGCRPDDQDYEQWFKKAASNGCKDVRYYITEKCKGCTICRKWCPSGAISGGVKKQHTIDQSKCTHCGKCIEHCKFRGAFRLDYSIPEV